MNDRFDLRIITQPHSQVYWGYFRRLVFGNSSTKHNKLTYFSNSILFCSDVFLPFFPTYRLVFMQKLPISHVCLSPVRLVSDQGRTTLVSLGWSSANSNLRFRRFSPSSRIWIGGLPGCQTSLRIYNLTYLMMR